MEAEDNKSTFLDRGKEGKLYSLCLIDLRQKKRKLRKSGLEVAISSSIWKRSGVKLGSKSMISSLSNLLL